MAVKKAIRFYKPYSKTHKKDNIENVENFEDGVSVCISAYDTAEYIEECLDSVYGQSYFLTNDNWEVLVGIDCCEQTLLKVKSIMHKYKNIRVFMMDSNKGTYITCNTIIKNAKYRYILRFDSDDIMKKDMVEIGIKNIKQNDLIKFGYKNFGDEKIEIPIGISYGVIMFKKTIFEYLNGYKDWICGADSDILRRFKHDGRKIYEERKTLFYRRIHKKSLTHNVKTNFDSELRKSILENIKTTNYSLLENRIIPSYITNSFTEITLNDNICSNIVNLNGLTNNDIEKILKDKAKNSKLKLNINFKNPKTIQDKIHYLMVYDDNKMLKSKCADKILLHDYCKKILGEDICVPIIKVYDKPEDINFDELPNKYVLKCNHGYAMNILCMDNTKNNFVTPKNLKLKTREDCINQMNVWLKTNFGDINYQWHYALIEPKCYAEVFMDDGNISLTDYKVWCFNGVPYMIEVISDRYTKDFHFNVYDTNWNLMDLGWGGKTIVLRPDLIDKKPKHTDKMIEYASKLSKDFKFVRVDFYSVNDKIYLGELTFSPNGGLFKYGDKKTDMYIGSLLKL